MSQTRITWLADVLQAGGCMVKTYEGWLTRGRPTGDFDPFGVLIHHTGTATSMTRPAPTVPMCIKGRPDLPGPLCHVVIGFDGLCHVIAAGRANHAGTNKGSGPIAAGDGNAQMIGFEVDYSGSQAMSPVQFDAMVKASAAVLKKLGKNESFARGHKETSTSGKWDPGKQGSSSPEYRMDGIRAEIKKALAATDKITKWRVEFGPPNKRQAVNIADKSGNPATWVRAHPGVFQVPLGPVIFRPKA